MALLLLLLLPLLCKGAKHILLIFSENEKKAAVQHFQLLSAALL
jgi:hypothetical protein